MNCRNWEERIALYAGGDLPPREAAEIEAHLQDCVGCRQFAAELREHIAWMCEAHRELPAAVDFAAVRTGVLARLEGRPRPAVWGVAWAGGFAAIAAMVLLIAHNPRREPAKPAPQVAVVKPPVQTVENPPSQPARRRRHTHTLRPKQAPEPSEPLLVKLITDDPDVVIYWIVDPKGD